jgi:general secretion pathway protein A
MILDYYKLAEQPFGVTPDPRFLYLSATHREAMASATQGLQAGRGFGALIAPPGMGKTTILFDFLNKLRGRAKTVFLFQAQHSPQGLLRNILEDLEIEEDANDCAAMQRKLHEYLVNEFRQGRKLVVVLDEAQNLDDTVLEMVRMLSNFETSREKLMHLILSGQPSLAEKLASPHLTQLRQRVSIVARLEPFSDDDTRLYIDHRLRVAGFDFKTSMFSDEALAMIARYSGGIPRNINNICFNAMCIGCADQQKTINTATIGEVVSDLDLDRLFATSTPNMVTQVPEPAPRLSLEAPSREMTRPRTWARRWGLVAALAALTVLTVLSFTRMGSHAAGVPSPPDSRPAKNVQVPLQEGLGAQTNQQPVLAKVAKSVFDGPATKSVVVKPEQTLCKISIQVFGKCDEANLARFRKANPTVTNTDHIEVGQTIRIPDSPESQLFNAAAQVPTAATSEMEKR